MGAEDADDLSTVCCVEDDPVDRITLLESDAAVTELRDEGLDFREFGVEAAPSSYEEEAQQRMARADLDRRLPQSQPC